MQTRLSRCRRGLQHRFLVLGWRVPVAPGTEIYLPDLVARVELGVPNGTEIDGDIARMRALWQWKLCKFRDLAGSW